MRIPTHAGAAVLAAALSALTCSFPDDTSDQVYVVVYQSDSLASRGVLGDGEQEFVVAKAYQLVGVPDTGNLDDIELHNVEFAWSSDNDNIVSVQAGSFGSADVEGEGPGSTTVRAKVVNFESAAEGTTDIRVSGLYAIDSIQPDTAHFGDKVTLSGVRVNLTLFATLGGAQLIPDIFSFQGNLNGVGSLEYWVPPGAFSDSVFIFGPGVFGLSDPVNVIEFDLYEPNDSNIVDISLNGPAGPRTIQGFPTLFFNPALFYEPPVNPWAEEWFRFTRSDTTRATTFIVTSKFAGDTAFTYLTDSVLYTGGGFISLAGDYYLSPDFSQCNGAFFNSGGKRSLTTIHALRSLPQRTLQLFLASAGSGGYEMTVIDGYFTVDRRIVPDRFEENDLWCVWADQNFFGSTDSTSPARKHIVIGAIGPQNGAWFDSTLTIDNPAEMDWIRIRVQPQALAFDSMLVIRTKALPLSAVDASDFDLYVMRASDFAFMGASTNVGSGEALNIKLAAGDYYLGFVDVAQQPTKFSICMGKGAALGTCFPPGAAGAPAPPIAPSVLRLPRREPRDPTVRPAGAPRSPLPRP